MQTLVSDHDTQIISIQWNKYQNVSLKKPSRKYNHSNILRFKEILKQETWEDVYQSDLTVNESYDRFHVKYLSYFNDAFPLKLTAPKKQWKNWITPGIRTSCVTLKFLHLLCKYNNDDSQTTRNFYKKYKKIYKRVLTSAKRMQVDNEIAQSDNKIKTTWNIIKRECGKDRKLDDNIKIIENSTVTVDPDIIANKFNSHFSNIASNLNKIPRPRSNTTAQQILIESTPKSLNSLILHPTANVEVHRILSQMKNKTSTDIDTIPCKIVKLSSKYISVPLAYLVNKSFEEGVFPNKLKHAKIVPIYKSGTKTTIENYRPISMLPVFSKIFERIVYNRLREFLSQHQQLSDEQHGFRQNRNTTSAIYELTNTVLKSIDKNEKVMAIFCDLSKAFDLVDHKIILDKLEHYGVRGVAHKWFKSYLDERQQLVEIKYQNQNSGKLESHISDSQLITCGVPQGSILGPLLFLLYINDLPLNVNITEAQIILFADDTSAIVTAKNNRDLELAANHIVSLLNNWFTANKLLLNESKTNLIHFNNKGIDVLNVNSISRPLAFSNCTKFLGVHIDCKMKWEDHIQKLAKKLSSACYA